MSGQLMMWKAHILHITGTPHLLISLLLSFALAIIFFFVFRNAHNIKRKVTYLYLHILFIFLPFVLSAFAWKCVMPIVSCSPKMITYLVSFGSGFALFLSFVALPYVYNWASRAKEIQDEGISEFVKTQSWHLGIPAPRVYAIEDIAPRAYSITNIRPSIFMTVGLCEILTSQELEAVLLHELFHIAQKTSFWKFSATMLKFFSPLSFFITTDEEMCREEHDADEFAVRRQGTRRFIESAKNKVTVMQQELEN